MKPRFDIRTYKKDLRTKYRGIRKEMKPDRKAKLDKDIRHRITSLHEYKQRKVFLCYVSTPEEINTHPLIEQAIADGKIVGVPYCIDGTREMDFYRITSLKELTPRTFGVLEPIAKKENKLTNFDDALCVLPGVSFDPYGYRLGYGGGYYDRFLSQKFTGKTAGICYQACIHARLIHGRFDVPSDYIITEKGIRKRQIPKRKYRGRKPKR